MKKISNIKYQISKIHIKIQNFALWIIILIFAFCILNFRCFAEIISSTELLKNPRDYDGKRIIYEGEVIGDVMERGSFVWVNLKDKKFALGVYLAKEILPPIKFLGSYKATGDFLRIVGTFHAHCLEHGGDMDIHAEKVEMIKEGFLREEIIYPLRRLWTKRFFICSFFLLSAITLRNLRRKKGWKQRLKK
ncbi:MAG: hypothetical protein NC834_00335 [Candidatus Omnitrophica bacterium]|nr:hypothetical protein [Candidatus Omnitrophota bacterium]